MKQFPLFRLAPRRREGVALLIVLGSLIFISAIILAFLSSTSTENQASESYATTSSVKLLAEMPVNIVQAQIKTATSETDQFGTGTAWASQPGMIRTFDTTGKLVHAYKLYSSDNIKPDTISVAGEAGAIPSDWYTKASLFTDLNEPVLTAPATNNAPAVRRYPILDPAAFDAPVQGLSVATTGTVLAPTKTKNPEDRAPMPVKWLYVLKNAQVVAPTVPTGGQSSTAVTVKSATKENPIVARIAYWADDETAKININTAAGDELNNPTTTPGSFWDTPRYNSAFEVKLSAGIPVKNEYQRFPGSPATVFLAEAFSYKSPKLTRDQIASIAPRIGTGGTQGGTVVVTSGGGGGTTSPNPMVLDADRLYSSIDELLYRNPAATDTSRTANSPLNKTDLENAKFVLTANSRAPEVNLFNLPRISMWPLATGDTANPVDSANNPYFSAFDKLIQRCTTIGAIPPNPALGPTTKYYLERKDSTSSTVDAALNGSLYDYLDYLTNTNIPGFNGKFGAKYAANRSQLLVEMLDYIRCTNLYDSYLLSGSDNNDTFAYTHITPKGNADWTGLGQVTPMVMRGKMGFGRFSTLSEAGLIFSDEAEKPSATDPAVRKNNFPDPSPPLATGEKIVQAAWVMEPFCVSEGFPVLGNNMTWTVEGLENLMIKDSTNKTVPLFAPGVRSQTFDHAAGKITKDGGSNTGGVGDIRNFANYSLSHPISVQQPGPYQFLGLPVRIKGNLVVTGANITITINSGTGSSVSRVQTIVLDFPSSSAAGFTSPVFPPKPLVQNSLAYRLTQTKGASDSSGNLDLDTWITAAPGTVTPYTGPSYETVRTMIASTSDIRQAALLPTINNAVDNIYAKGANFDSLVTQYRNSGTFQFGNHATMAGVDNGKYVAAMPSQYPLVKFRNGSPSITTGDYENGVALYNDGAYINRPDEGVSADNGDKFINYFADFRQGTNLSRAFFSPNRQIPSPGMLGSLPTAPWTTLLFRPQSSISPKHPNSGDPKDYLLMDLFWMPIVEPYAISEPFSTAGKINLNQQIMPFSYIKRSTALYAALQGESYLALPNSVANGYKSYSTQAGMPNFRKPINVDKVLSQLDTRFGNSDIYRSAAEICDLDLDNGAAATDFATTLALTGDSSRERPYTNLYQKLTTKSNTYTVHFRVQELKQISAGKADWTTWDESKDKVSSEYRGATLIERYIDPNASIRPYLNNNPSPTRLDSYYKFRVVSSKQFTP